MTANHGIIAFVAVAAATSLTNAAWAQDTSGVTSKAGVSTVSEIVGADANEVAARMQADPTLVILSAKALGARSDRKATGKALAIVGFTILGVGDTVGTVMMMTAPGYPNVQERGRDQFLAGVGVAVVSLGVGLALGISGILKMARPSDKERHLGDYYERTKPAGTWHFSPAPTAPLAPPAQNPPPLPAAPPAATPSSIEGLPTEPSSAFVVPVLSFTF